MKIITPQLNQKTKLEKFFDKVDKFFETISWPLLMLMLGWILGRITEAMARGAF